MRLNVHTSLERFEEAVLAFLLGAMVCLTFANVMLRYLFGSSLVWSLELTLILFSWLVLFGTAYGFKKALHIGVDSCVVKLPSLQKRLMLVFAALMTLIYCGLFLKGAWDYWAPFAEFSPTTGRWFPLGLDLTARGASFFETEQVPMLDSLRWLEGAINYDERYEKLPRVIPYIALPISALLMFIRTLEGFVYIILGRHVQLIASQD